MAAKVLGGSFASMPSNAFDTAIVKSSLEVSLLTIDPVEKGKTEEKDNGRPEKAIDMIAAFNWWVAVS